MNRDLKFLRLAKRESLKSDHPDHQIGCIVVRKGRIIGLGRNLMKTHPKAPHNWKFVHAEFMAVLNANFDIKGATAYIYREHKNGSYALAKPCQSCYTFLKEQGIAQIIYTDYGYISKESINEKAR